MPRHITIVVPDYQVLQEAAPGCFHSDDNGCQRKTTLLNVEPTVGSTPPSAGGDPCTQY